MEDLMNPRTYLSHLTVGELRKAIAELPDEAPVFYQRIEDVYFEKHNWKVETKPCFDWPGELDQYPRILRCSLSGRFCALHNGPLLT